jgi:uncharacterized membrane protein
MSILIVILLISIGITVYIITSPNSENAIIKQFYYDRYGVVVKKETVQDLEVPTRIKAFIEWMIKQKYNYVFIKITISKKSMRFLDKYTIRNSGHPCFETYYERLAKGKENDKNDNEQISSKHWNK